MIPLTTREMCEVCKKITPVEEVLIARCGGCHFLAIACFRCEPWAYADRQLNGHLRHVNQHARGRVGASHKDSAEAKATGGGT